MNLARKTARLVLRPYRAKDFAAWREANLSHAEKINRWDQSVKKPDELSRARFGKILARQAGDRKTDKFYDLGVFLKDGSLIGAVSLMDLSRGVFQNAYLGYWLFNRHWGRGLAAEAVQAALDIAFTDLKLHRVEAGIEPGNARSHTLARRLGFRREGLSKRRLKLGGRWVDIRTYALTTEDLDLPWKGKAQLIGPRY